MIHSICTLSPSVLLCQIPNQFKRLYFHPHLVTVRNSFHSLDIVADCSCLRGICVNSQCVCSEGYTGSNCSSVDSKYFICAVECCSISISTCDCWECCQSEHSTKRNTQTLCSIHWVRCPSIDLILSDNYVPIWTGLSFSAFIFISKQHIMPNDASTYMAAISPLYLIPLYFEGCRQALALPY